MELRVRSPRLAGACMAAALCLRRAAAGAAQPVSLELVVAIDGLLSINDVEFYLQLGGVAEAFRDEEVVASILQRSSGVAVTLVQWNGTANSYDDFAEAMRQKLRRELMLRMTQLEER